MIDQEKNELFANGLLLIIPGISQLDVIQIRARQGAYRDGYGVHSIYYHWSSLFGPGHPLEHLRPAVEALRVAVYG